MKRPLQIHEARPGSSLSRRAWLGGAGAILGLPAFEAMLPKVALAESAAPKRILGYYVPCGINMPKFTPTATGANYELTPILMPLAKLKKKILVLSGLDNAPARPDGAGDHAAGTAGFMTCRHIVKTQGADIRNGVSMDQVAAGVLGKSTRIASMQLGIDGGGSTGDCDSGYSCAYARNVSWASDKQPLPKAVNPQVVFDQIFQGFDPQATAQERARRTHYKTSILDYALDEAGRLSGRLGKSDNAKLDEYLSGVRDLEKRIKGAASGPTCSLVDKPATNLDYPKQVRVMADLMVLAFQCDATRVMSFMLGNAASGRSYDFIGVTGGHHEISHHKNDPVNLDKLEKIDTWEVGELAYLLEKMDSITENGGTMLDNTAVFFSSEIEDGDSHSHMNMPILVAGTAGGALTSGRHLHYDKETVSSLFISLLGAVGVQTATFGDDGMGPLNLS